LNYDFFSEEKKWVTNLDTQFYWFRAMYNGHWIRSNEIQPDLDKIQTKLDGYPNKNISLTPETDNPANLR